MENSQKTIPRVNFSLLKDDRLEEIRCSMEKKLDKRLSLAEVVRMALQELAKANNI